MDCRRADVRQLLLVLILVVLGSVKNSEAHTDELLRWFGFGSIGVTKSNSDIPYRRGFITQSTTFDVDTKLGLNGTADIGKSWFASAQLVARGSSNFFRAEADWIFVSYKPLNSLAITFGKQRLPIWLMSDRYDIGLVQPWIRPPDEFYFLNPITTFIGPNLRFSQEMREWNLGGEVYSGATTADRDFADSTERDMATNLIGGYLCFGRGSLFTLRVAYAQADVEVLVQTPVDTTTNTPLGPVTTRNEIVFHVPPSPFRYYSVGAQGEWKNIVLYTEYSKTSGDDPRLGTIHSGYITLGYRIGEVLLPHYTYAALDSDQPPPQNPGSQHSNILGLRARLNPRVAIKFEWHQTNVVSGKGLFSTDPGRAPVQFLGASLDLVF